MVLIRGIHTTHIDNLDSIREHGLWARFPGDHNWKFYAEQPKGVYVSMIDDPEAWYIEGDGLPHDYTHVNFLVHYCGPADIDLCCFGALVLYTDVSAEFVVPVVSDPNEGYPEIY